MANKKLNEKDKRVHIQICLTPEEHAILERRAEEEMLPISRLAKILVVRNMEVKR